MACDGFHVPPICNMVHLSGHTRTKEKLILGVLVFMILAIFRIMKFFALNGTGKIRLCDAWGCGHFNAPRGDHKHKGIDFDIPFGSVVYAPFPCKVVRLGFPYSDDTSYRLVEIQGTGNYSDYKAKIMYVKDLPSVGETFKEGQKLCIADDITKRYSSTMTNHVHFELYAKDELLNPEPFFKV
ncbi:M23 family metallopeptidase [Flagellimonas aequoris]|uniref:M23 family metallopeptidase n=2 Tax=Flagellimonas aequoris TaxID=2306997 RepID=A0ABY3KPG8_9FLAO|nr:M23 family metallopeptidase [Allomuricauda aequoris]TXK00410.1 M23 family metallopeptidase [Allomuricauda aequoris]